MENRGNRYGNARSKRFTSILWYDPGDQRPVSYTHLDVYKRQGKTTLLNIMAALDKPTEGTVLLDGKPLSSIKDKDIAQFRRDNLGFVFQEFNLLDTFNVKDNILLPLVLKGENYKHMDSKLQPIAKELGISALLEKYPYTPHM